MEDSQSDRISLVVTGRGKVAKNKNRSCKKICEICSTILINIVPAIVTMIAILIWAMYSLKANPDSIKEDFLNSTSTNSEFVKKTNNLKRQQEYANLTCQIW